MQLTLNVSKGMLHKEPVSTKVRAAMRGKRVTAFGGDYMHPLSFMSLASCALVSFEALLVLRDWKLIVVV